MFTVGDLLWLGATLALSLYGCGKGFWRDMGSSASNNDHLRSAYLWNTAGSMLNAFQSVFMLMVITRTCDLVTAGVFTLAYANANLFLTLGGFGMRNFQASDVAPKFGFRAFGMSRVLTCIAMVACSWLWLAWASVANGYGWDKTLAVALMTLMKGVDAVEDVFDGSYQQQSRLDVAGRLLTFRTGTTIVVFCLMIAVTRSLVVATAVGFVWTIVFLVVGVMLIRRACHLPGASRGAAVSPWPLLAECVPLFLSAFLLYYVGSAPKYAIDATMLDADQAIYGFIAMPVFVVGLLAQFVYAPLVQPLSERWSAGDATGFRGAFGKQVGIIAGITLACVAAAAVAGPPVLGWLYACDLDRWRVQLCALVTGGGLLALASLFTMGMTIMRAQRRLVIGYVVVAVVALAASGPLVRLWGIDGAVACYVGCMFVLACWFGVLFVAESGGGKT